MNCAKIQGRVGYIFVAELGRMSLGEVQMQGDFAMKDLIPDLARSLGLDSDDPALPKLNAVLLDLHKLNLAVRPIAHSLSEDINTALATPNAMSAEEGLRYGVDFFFGRYKGRPQSVEQNALTAVYQNRQGVEVWRIMKSIAFVTGSGEVILVHLRGDRQINVKLLAAALDLQEDNLRVAELPTFGLEHGTVNPFSQLSGSKTRHVFDEDLIGGHNCPRDAIVLTSSGDARIYVAIDIRGYVTAASKSDPDCRVCDVSQFEKEVSRIFVRHPIEIVGGDSGIDTLRFAETILLAARSSLERQGAYFGDRSMPNIRISSDPELAGSIDALAYGAQLRRHVRDIVIRIREDRKRSSERAPIVTFSSMAMHGVAGDQLRKLDELVYFGPQEALDRMRAQLIRHGIQLDHTVLLGLSSVYDTATSAFTGDVLATALPVDDNARRAVHEFIHECKVQRSKASHFYDIIKRLLKRATRGQFELLKGRNILVVLGASELEGFVKTVHAPPSEFVIIASYDPLIVAEVLRGAADQVRLIFFEPTQALARLIAEKTLKPSGEAYQEI